MTTIQSLLDQRSELLAERRRLQSRYYAYGDRTVDGVIGKNVCAKKLNDNADELEALTDKCNRMIEEMNR